MTTLGKDYLGQRRRGHVPNHSVNGLATSGTLPRLGPRSGIEHTTQYLRWDYSWGYEERRSPYNLSRLTYLNPLLVLLPSPIQC